MASNTYHVHKNRNFSQIANSALRDSRLSFRARGILAFVLSHQDGWKSSAAAIAESTTEGRGAILTAFKELEALGYRSVRKVRSEGGRWATEVHWFEEPPGSNEPESGFRTPADSTLTTED